MSNILKNFMKSRASAVSSYTFQEAEKLEIEDAPAVQADGPPEEVAEPAPPKAPEPKSPIDYAQVQADAILEEARQKADAILGEAEAAAQEEIQALRAQAQEEGFQQGYAEGMASSATEVKRQQEELAAKMEGEIQAFLEKASLAREALIDETKAELVDLCLAVAEKIVRVSLKSSSDIVARMIQGATEKLKRKEWVRVYIASCDVKGMAKISPGLTASLSTLSDHVKIVPMADDESGTCIIEMPDEIIDASVSTQISNMKDLLLENAP